MISLVDEALRSVHTVSRRRAFAGGIAIALIPFATSVDAIAALYTVAVLMVALVAYEAIGYRERRAELRASHA